MKPALLSTLLFLAFAANGEESGKVDYCHDAKVNQDWLKMIAEYPKDPVILKLAGLREGLCLMIDRGQITHEQGTDIWEDEKNKSIIQRSNEELTSAPKLTL
ncbi:hypothetical protein [Methylobacter sp. YRD-M1]|uniref:hypothetical protein n=1 Tax=Methylobacter sp. YRD-M1 TaxID=2911520 RepID=UPI00227A6372|nr:hypothetical protein [Methylobacter sp. YRD-M1]WAK04598.1 hypothetical protein LZ558_22345 [Methylobacter sp. YRD-M1]